MSAAPPAPVPAPGLAAAGPAPTPDPASRVGAAAATIGWRWLSFFGRPALHSAQQSTALQLRYRKGYALLAFLAVHANQPQRRRSLAEWLWPELEPGARQTNLRGLLADLGPRCSAWGLGMALQIERDWLTLHTGPQLLTDAELAQQPALRQALAPELAALLQARWFDLPELEATDHALGRWVQAQRAWLAQSLRAGGGADAAAAEAVGLGALAGPLAGAVKAAAGVGAPLAEAAAGAAAPLAEAATALAAGAVEDADAAPWSRLALLWLLGDADEPAPWALALAAALAEPGRTVPDGVAPAAAAAVDSTESPDSADSALATLARALRLGGARALAPSAHGLGLVFGYGSRSAGWRRAALRAALACLEQMPHLSLGLSCGLGRYLEPAAPVPAGAGPALAGAAPTAGAALQGRLLLQAQRLALAAAAGSLATDEHFADLLAGTVRIDRRRGAGAGERVFLLSPADLRRSLAAAALPEAPFVGRGAALAALLGALEQEGAPVLALLGAPGVGKTRLAQELARHPSVAERVQWFYCRAELQHRPWACVQEFLARADLAALPERERAAAQGLLQHGHVGLDTLGALHAALLRLLQGALALVDDAHWADAASCGAFDALLKQAGGPRWLLTRRAGPGGWLPAGAQTQELPPLDDAAALELLTALEPAAAPARAQRAAALARARGLPLFLLAEASAAQPALAEAVDSLCNLPGAPALALGAAALLGQQFERADLSALVGPEACAHLLQAGAAQGLLVGYHRELWGFAHPLLREHALGRLGAPEQQRLALAAAQRLQARGELARAAELCHSAGQAQQAAQLWLQAGQAALAAEDVLAACAVFERLARQGYPAGLGGGWARIWHLRALILRHGYGIAEIEPLCAQTNAVLDLEPEPELAFACLALHYLNSGSQSQTLGLERARELLALAGSPEQRFTAHWALANTHFFVGDTAAAQRHFDLLLGQELTLAQRTRYLPSDPLAFLSTFHAWLRWYVGDVGWRAEIEQHLAQVQAQSSRQGRCIAHVFAAFIYLCAGERAALAQHAAQALDIAHNEAFAFWEVYAQLLDLVAAAQGGSAPTEAHCASLEQAALRGYPAGANTVRWLLAEAWVAAGCWQAARQHLERTLAQAADNEHAYCLPDLLRLHATALHGCGAGAAAQAALAQARALAQQRGWNGWLARWGAGSPAQLQAAACAQGSAAGLGVQNL